MKDTVEPNELPDLEDVQEATNGLLNLLRAADLLRDPCLCAESGPLIAVLEASIDKAHALDDMVNAMLEAKLNDWVKQ